MQILDAVVPVPDDLQAGVIPATEEELASWAELEPGAGVMADEGARPLDAAGRNRTSMPVRSPARRST